MSRIRNPRTSHARGFLRPTILFSVLVFGGVLATLLFLGRSSDQSDLQAYRSWAPADAPIASGPGTRPDDWFQRQRAYPFDGIPESNFAARRDARAWFRQQGAGAPTPTGSNDQSAAGSSDWVLAGPSNVHGRITDLVADPGQPDRVFVAAANGGVFRSLDGGENWTPVFDEMGVQSIGAITMDPNDTNTIYVGTGETNAAGDTYAGDGIYKSTDGGDTWMNIGLSSSAKIGRIVVDPSNSQRVFVAVTGPLYTTSSERGVYRSEDGGDTWEQILSVADDAGAIDLVLDANSSRGYLYAATWERLRSTTERRVGGSDSGVWRSADGGDTWTRLDNSFGLPAPASNIGRIGLSQSVSNPDVLFAFYVDDPGSFLGVYKTTDAGDSWSRVNDGALSGVPSSFGWYFGQIRVDPKDADTVFVLGVPVYRTTNGGASWFDSSGGMHVDHHAMWIDPTPGSNRIYAGNDGGFYESTNGGADWTKRGQLPITQFYAITVDEQRPWRLYGGTQDNSTNRTWDGGVDDWDVIYFGDGFYTLVDPGDSDLIYAEYQYGGLGKSTDGGESWDSARDGIDSNDRRNWSTPVVMDPSDADVLYYGTYRLYRSTNQAESWSAISPDLTGGDPPGGLVFGTITTIDVARTNGDAVVVGTDDGRVWVTYDGGDSWTNVTGSLPDRWVTRVAFDPLDEAILYVTLSGYRWDEYVPHLLRSTNGGSDWTDVGSSLPEIPLNDIIVDPMDSSRLYVASDAGVFVTYDLGESWGSLGTALPLTSVFDLHLHESTRKLVAGTHGRSMWTFDLSDVSSTPNHPASSSALETRVSPNPFRESTRISLQLPPEFSASSVEFPDGTHGATLGIYDAQGREVRHLQSQAEDPTREGKWEWNWDGRDNQGKPVPAGAYFYRFSTDDFEAGGTVLRIE